MMVSRLTLIIPTMCIRSLGLEGNFCFNKSWAVKSITALAIYREKVKHILIFHKNFVILTWSGGTSRRRRKRIDQAVVPTFPTLKGVLRRSFRVWKRCWCRVCWQRCWLSCELVRQGDQAGLIFYLHQASPSSSASVREAGKNFEAKNGFIGVITFVWK